MHRFLVLLLLFSCNKISAQGFLYNFNVGSNLSRFRSTQLPPQAKNNRSPGFIFGAECKYQGSERLPLNTSSGVLFAKATWGNEFTFYSSTRKINEKDYSLIIPIKIGYLFYNCFEIQAGGSIHYLLNYRTEYGQTYFTIDSSGQIVSTEFLNFNLDKKSNDELTYNNFTLRYVNPTISLYGVLEVTYHFEISKRLILSPYFQYERQWKRFRSIDYLSFQPFNAGIDFINFGLKIRKK